MIVAHKIELNPTVEQVKYLTKACAVDRFTYNWALGKYKEQLKVYQESKKDEDRPNINKLKKEFNKVKHEQFTWVTEVTKCASEQSFVNLNKAFSNFFNKKLKSKFPKFHNKDKKNSFYISNDKFKIKKDLIQIPKLGWVKMKEQLKFTGNIMSGTVSLNGNKWFISISVELAEKEAEVFYSEKLTNNPRLKDEVKVSNFKEDKSQSIGIDLGIKTAVVTSDGEEIQAPKPLKKFCKKLKRTQKALSRKIKGSKNRNKAKVKLSKLHAKIANIRKDWLHKVTKYLCVNYKTIALEDLHIKGMIKNHNLAKAISDVGLGMFRCFIEYKSKLTNTQVNFIDRFAPSSKTCSCCGWKNEKLSLKDRTFICNTCNLIIDRDYNASINILNFSTQGY